MYLGIKKGNFTPLRDALERHCRLPSTVILLPIYLAEFDGDTTNLTWVSVQPLSRQ